MSRQTLTTLITAAVIVTLMALAMQADAQTAVRTSVSVVIPCTNENFTVSDKCTAPPDYFIVEENGEVWGYLTSGVQFTQTNVSNDLGVRLQRFNLEDAKWYISDQGIIYADSDIQALSIYLTL